MVSNLSGTLAVNDSFTLFSAAAYSGSFASISPATPGTGLAWNTNFLAVDGTLRVANVAATTATDDTQIIFGATIDDRLTGQVWVTVIATGLGGTGRSGPRTPSLVSALTAGDDDLEPPSFLRN